MNKRMEIMRAETSDKLYNTEETANILFTTACADFSIHNRWR